MHHAHAGYCDYAGVGTICPKACGDCADDDDGLFASKTWENFSSTVWVNRCVPYTKPRHTAPHRTTPHYTKPHQTTPFPHQTTLHDMPMADRHRDLSYHALHHHNE